MTEQLRALALAATPIDPDLYGDRYFGGDYSRADFTKEQDAFARAANPSAVLSLLDEIDRLKAEIADHERAYELLFKENAGLRKDADRYRWLCTMLGETQLPTLIERITSGYVADYKPSIDAAIDAATLAAKGESHAD
jgi:hypothetical protein